MLARGNENFVRFLNLAGPTISEPGTGYSTFYRSTQTNTRILFLLFQDQKSSSFFNSPHNKVVHKISICSKNLKNYVYV